MCRKQFAIVALVLSMALTGGCALGGKKLDLPPQEAVQVRAQGWADAVMARDYNAAYGFTSPNFREFASAESYRAQIVGSINWTSAQVRSVQCEKEVCTAVVMIEYEAKRYGFKSRRPLDQKWLQSDGEWWLYIPPN